MGIWSSFTANAHIRKGTVKARIAMAHHLRSPNTSIVATIAKAEDTIKPTLANNKK